MTEALDTSPGSLDQFAEKHDLDPQNPDTLSAFTEAAGEYRVTLAEGLGITLEELHVSPNPETGTELESPASLAV